MMPGKVGVLDLPLFRLCLRDGKRGFGNARLELGLNLMCS